MNDYIEVKFRFELSKAPSDINAETAADILSSILADSGFESFVFNGDTLSAYIPERDFAQEIIEEAISTYPLSIPISASSERIEGCDWNAEWEKNYFKPIIVDGLCCIHSTFHRDYPICSYDIVIDPKMAFGTGHHATTAQIIRRLLSINLKGKSVIDMGTGTGILAILARMRGASRVTAIEIDPAAEANARENILLNGCNDIDLRLGDASRLNDLHTDIFIANINRNIILNDLEAYASTLNPGATMLLSGFYDSDIPMIVDKAADYALEKISHTTEGDHWACLELKKS